MAARYDCRVARSVDEVAEHLASWRALEERSLEDQFYASPDFLIASLRHFHAEGGYSVVFVYANDGGGDHLVGCAAFSHLPPSWRTPVRVLSSLVSPHSYLSAPLLDRDRAGPALRALWDWIDRPEQPWTLVSLRNVSAESATWRAIREELSRRGRAPWVKDRFHRAVLRRHASFDAYLGSLPKGRRKNYQKKSRRLGEAGRVEVLLHRNTNGTPDLANRFMEIESRSWKGGEGTSLAQSPADCAFFAEITAAYGARDELFFVELRRDGEPIALSSNFARGNTLFAFKVAYDPAFREFSPGILTEIETVRFFHDAAGFERGEGGTAGASYLDAYWRDTAEIQHVLVPTRGASASAALRVLATSTSFLRAAKKLVRPGAA